MCSLRPSLLSLLAPVLARIAAIRAVLPPELVIAAVGGVSDRNFADYIRAGITAFGLGTSLYKPGMSAADVRARADATIAAYDADRGG